jgi:hypothetical protein
MRLSWKRTLDRTVALMTFAENLPNPPALLADDTRHPADPPAVAVPDLRGVLTAVAAGADITVPPTLPGRHGTPGRAAAAARGTGTSADLLLASRTAVMRLPRR